MIFILTKFFQSLLALLGVLTLSFFLIYKIPSGDPTKVILGYNANEQDCINLKRELGLDKAPPVQFYKYCKKIIKGDLGRSYISDFEISETIARRFPITLILTSAAMGIALVAGLTLGVLSIVFKKANMLVSIFSVGLGSVPVFYIALILLWVFSYRLGLFPINGLEGEKGILLPAIALSLFPMANIARIAKVEMAAILEKGYIRTARSFGFSELDIIFRHALKNTLISLISSMSNSFAQVLGGTFFVEYIFSLPGIGLLAVDSMLNYDFPVIQSIVLVTSVCFILINLTTDVLYGFVDPRIYKRG